jgi:hypothetical protein
MLEKINIKNEFDRQATNVGIALMTLATVVGMTELPSHGVKAVTTLQPVMVNSSFNELNNPIRREKEEVGIEYVSYAETQRTPARSGSY